MKKRNECIADQLLINDGLRPCRETDPLTLRKGVSVYEIFRIMKGAPVFLEDHLNRLFHSLELEELTIRENRSEITAKVQRLIAANSIDTGKVKLIVTFSQAPGAEDYDLVVYFVPFEPPTPEQYKAGIAVTLCTAIRYDPNAKVLDTEARRLADEKIEQLGVYETLLVNADGYITEGSRSNLFFISGNRLITPPDDFVLQGIARKNILRICREEGIPVDIRRVHQQELSSFDSAFLSGTTPQVLPIRRIDDIAYSVEDRLARFLMKAYQDKVLEYISRTS